MRYVTKATVQVWANIWPVRMGKRDIIGKGTIIESNDGRNGYAYIEKPVRGYVAMALIEKIDEAPIPPPALFPGTKRLKFHSQIPSKQQNKGSFGIVPWRGTPSNNKPHSVILNDALLKLYLELQSQEYYDANIQNYPCDNPKIVNLPHKRVNQHDSFRWLFEHENTAFYGRSVNGKYSIPAQGGMGGNLIRFGQTYGKFTEVVGVTNFHLPTIQELYNRPDLVHYCWCVNGMGQMINPPCGSAFILVLNPVGLQGVSNLFNRQSKIWVSNQWL